MKMLVPAVFFLLTFNIVAAQVVTRCEEASGHAFYFGGMGWIKDAISGYELLLTNAGGEPDIIYKDATGTITSSRAIGEVLALPSRADFSTFLVIHPDATVEHYVFELDENGNGMVVAGLIRTGPFAKSSLMSAVCKSP